VSEPTFAAARELGATGAIGCAPFMTTLACTVVLGSLVFAVALAAPVAAQERPGYSGTFPSAAGQQALADVAKREWVDTAGRVGGGTWQLHAGAVTPHPLGPGRGDVMEMRSAETKGPHLRLVREHLAINLPTTSDGDVVATLRWLGETVPVGLVGEPTPAWRLAIARLEGLGDETLGHRAVITGIADARGSVEMLVWNVGAVREPMTGTAQVVVDGQPLPVALVWPPKADPGNGKSHLELAPGSTLHQRVDVAALLAAAGKPKLGTGEHKIEFVFAVAAAAADKPAVLRSKPHTLQVEGDQGGKRPAR
jgi:hypothetical protein